MSSEVSNILVFFGVLFAVVYTIAIARQHHYAPGYIGRVTGRLFSLRVGCGSIFVGVVVLILLAAVLGGGDGITPIVAAPIFGVIWAWAALTDSTIYCPHCTKRVSANQDVCHKCGRDLCSLFIGLPLIPVAYPYRTGAMLSF